MKNRLKCYEGGNFLKKAAAFTLTELAVVIATLCLLAAVVFADAENPLVKAQQKAQMIDCLRNLKQVQLSFLIWSGDNGDKYPAMIHEKFGGAMESALAGNVAGIFQTISNELGTPKVLICPADATRTCATSFSTNFNNLNVSYFVGIDADIKQPKMLLSGDSNISIDGKPIRPGIVNLSSNSATAWTPDRHPNRGNIGLADGNIVTPTTLGLKVLLTLSGHDTNRLAVP